MGKKRWLAMVAVAALLSAGCSDSDADVDTGVGDEIPVNPDAGDDDGAISTEPMCVEDEPDCDDTAVIPTEGQDLPLPDGD